MPRSRLGRTYRVQQLPARLHKHEVAAFLVSASRELGHSTNIEVFSTAPSLNVYEQYPTRVATLMFKETPQCFDNDQEQWKVFSEDPHWPRNIIFDTHFGGFTPLNDIGLVESRLDCVAISGLASHAFGSWKERGDSNFMWLRDQLPLDFPHARSIIYGYDTRLLDSQSHQSIDDLALSFVSAFKSISSANTVLRSLVFFTHSLGGIVLKRAVAAAANSGQDETVLHNIRMIFFFGVPNQGMHMSHLLAMTQEQPNRSLVNELSRDSNYLSDIDIQFSGLALCRTLRAVSVYETKSSATTKEIRPGTWTRTGPPELLVTRSSAIQRGTRPLDIVPVNEDHSNIVKFLEQDPAYEIVRSRLHEVRLLAGEAWKSMTEPASFERVSGVEVEDHNKIKDFKDMLSSLSLEETVFRREQIEPRYLHTFAWIFADSKLRFTDWLRTGNGVYWIRGKPGSGKSTLMKFLYTDERTEQFLNKRRERASVISAWFFFHGRGSGVQRSFEGLLHSVLHQVLSASVELAGIVYPLYMEGPKIQGERWSLHYLRRALELVLRQDRFPVRLFLFLDALDEYEGQLETIFQFLKSIVSPSVKSATQVNVCFTSRTWNIFLEEFDQFPGFSIHEQTEADIETFTRGRMLEQKNMARMLRSADITQRDAAERLVSSIVKKARGVFLWVRLVVERVLRARSDGASIAELDEDIYQIPLQLEDYYDNIIKHIQQRYRQESYIMFEVLVRSTKQMTAADFASVIDCAFCTSFQQSVTQMGRGRLFSKPFEDFLRHVTSRSGGLIEVIGKSHNAKVVLMHQTVKDFVEKPGFEQRMLGQYSQPPLQNGHSYLVKYYVSRFSLDTLYERGVGSEVAEPAGRDRGNSKKSLQYCLLHAPLSELTTGYSQKEFLDSIGDSNVRAWRIGPESSQLNSVMSFAVWADCRLYVSDTFRHSHQRVEPSLLHVAIQRHFDLDPVHEEGRYKYRQALQWNGSLGPMCRLLLSLRADPNALLEGKKPFRSLLVQLWKLWGKKFRYSDNDIDIAAAFLEYNQDANVTFPHRIESDNGGFKTCKPLHLAHSRMTELLLNHGAVVNALTSSGHTALDLAVESTMVYGRYRSPTEARTTLTVLLDHGGRVTEFGTAFMTGFLKNLEMKSRPSGQAASVENLEERIRMRPCLRGIAYARLETSSPSSNPRDRTHHFRERQNRPASRSENGPVNMNERGAFNSVLAGLAIDFAGRSENRPANMNEREAFSSMLARLDMDFEAKGVNYSESHPSHASSSNLG